jgi:hypothetical protein
VFSTKDRRPCLTAQLRGRLWPFLGGIAREHQMKALSIGGVEDQSHFALLKRHKIKYDFRCKPAYSTIPPDQRNC